MDDITGVLARHEAWSRGDPDGARADLSGANMVRADLSGADLSGANLSGAYLAGANMVRADMDGAYLAGAKKPRGGARPGSGVKAKTTDGGALQRVSLTLDATTIETLRNAGGGVISEGARLAARLLRQHRGQS